MQPRGLGGRRRPGLVWAILILNTVSFVVLGLMGWLVFRYWSVLPDGAKAPLRGVSEVTWTLGAIAATLNVIGTIQLFRMRRSAFHLSAAAFLVGGVLGSVPSILGGTLRLSITGVLFGWVLPPLICWYLWRLGRAKILH
jgi:hypothetical protein